MTPQQRQYIAIDLKSFYASVECVERGLNPLDACLVVADASRTEKTICLAVSPALKAFGVGARPRLFEVVQQVRRVNLERGRRGTSTSAAQLADRPDLAVDYIVAPPRMALYLQYSARIYSIYLRYIAPEDIHVYSVDEVFIDITPYLPMYGLSPHDLAMRIIRDVLRETGITATVGIGTNMYLCKIAMDIKAKKMPPDAHGVRIAQLDEASYRREMWSHTPLTDFWRVGRGIAAKLERYGIRTMGDIARCSLRHEGLLYSLFGVNAELLIDHAWGWEPVTMPMIKAYRPESRSLCHGQVLSRPYSVAEARNVLLEMADTIALDLVDKQLLTKQVVLTVGYDAESLANAEAARAYTGKLHIDHYGRTVPFHAHGTANFPAHTSLGSELLHTLGALFDRIVNPVLLVRRLSVSVNRLESAATLARQADMKPEQLELFVDYDERRRIEQQRNRELRRQKAVLSIKKIFGKNAILRGINYADGATQRDRNRQIGGHHE